MASYNPRFLTPPEEEAVFPYRRVWRSFAIEIIGLLALTAGLFALFAATQARVPDRFALAVNVAIAVVPLALWAVFSLWAERAVPEPRRRLLAVMVVSALAANAVGLPLVNNVMQVERWLPMASALTRIVGYTFTVGIVQEAIKYTVVRYIVWPDGFRTRADGVAYMVAAAVGYATVINLSFVLTTPGATPDVTALRVFDNLAIQYAASALIGYGLAEVTFSRPSPLLLTLTLALAATVNGIAIPLRAGLVNASLTFRTSVSQPLRGLGFSAAVVIGLAVVIAFLIQNADRADRQAAAGKDQ